LSTMFHYFKHALLVASGAAVLSVGAAVPPAIAQPVAPNQTAASAEQCQMYHDWYNGDIESAFNAFLDGNIQAMNDKLGEADYDKNLASSRGCDVSSWRIVESRNPVFTVPVGPSQLALRVN
jgi:hypothetical protein